MFSEQRSTSRFQWDNLGDIPQGRPNLGEYTTVAVYRLMQYTLREVLIIEHGPEKAGQLLYDGGRIAGMQFCRNILDTSLDFHAFVARLQEELREQRIGILRIEKADIDKLEFVVVVAEDLDCSGLPVVGETVCDYDEGFIAGVLEAYTGQPFTAKEVDCWASGARVCRFEAKGQA